MDITIRKNVLEKIVEAAKDFAEDLNFFCYDDKSVMMQAYGHDKDDKNEIFLDILLTPGDGVLKHYRFSRETPLFICLSIRDFMDNLERTGDDAEFITIEFVQEKEGFPKIVAKFRPDGLCKDSFPMDTWPLWENDQLVLDEYFILPHVTSIITASRFFESCRPQLSSYNGDDHVLIGTLDPKVMQFLIPHENWMDKWQHSTQCGKEVMRIEVDTLFLNGPVLGELQMKYLKYFTKDDMAISKVSITLGSRYDVVIVQYDISHGGYIKFCSGPKDSVKRVDDSDRSINEMNLQELTLEVDDNLCYPIRFTFENEKSEKTCENWMEMVNYKGFRRSRIP